MAIDYKKEMDKLIHEKLTKIIKNEIIIAKNRLVVKFNCEPSQNFYLAFVQNIREIEDTQIYELYINKLNNNFNFEFQEKAKLFADKYKSNQLKQLINKSIKNTFDNEFKDQLGILLDNIAQSTLKQINY